MRGRIAGTLIRLACVGLFATATPVAAKTISITIGQKAELGGGNLVAKVTVGNTGDESAKSVAANLRFGDKRVRGKLHDDVAPNASFGEDLSLETGPLGPGRWPYEIAVDYADANLYPFQALLVTTIVVGSPPPPKIAVSEIKSAGIAESGSLSIHLKNLAGTDRDVSYRVIAPEGLEVPQAKGSAQLKAWGEVTTSVDIVNRTALAGSRYPVFVVAEYTDDDMHQSMVSQGVVEIVTPRNFWEQNQTLLWVGAGVLVTLWMGLVLRRALSRSS